ncbi:MAG: Xaa-Pro peptidase family protein [Treponema sp.]|jgi:Xaa-Pro dipeptidase|nr:Xaa-Pro peptidase family protein [Treponema sp.]
MNIYKTRLERLCSSIDAENVSLFMFEDRECRRDSSVRHLTGHPSDALFFLNPEGRNLLVPWDINLANQFAHADTVVPYNEFERDPVKALVKAISYFGLDSLWGRPRVEVPPSTPYPLFLQYAAALPNCEILCRNKGIYACESALRAVKDESEIRIYRHLVELTNELLDSIEINVRDGILETEADVALFIEAQARKCGCEGLSFETLAAGPERSFGIHAFPAYTDAPFAGKGLSILDFGLKYQGYTSDVTMSFARDVSLEQKELLDLTESAYDLALSHVRDHALVRDMSVAVDGLFASAGRTLPHGLGHGLGLDVHEEPFINSRVDNYESLKTGMVFTIEPGLYDPQLGGCRLENDVILGADGPEVLTKSRIVRL